jgi:hypothetical protein
MREIAMNRSTNRHFSMRALTAVDVGGERDQPLGFGSNSGQKPFFWSSLCR